MHDMKWVYVRARAQNPEEAQEAAIALDMSLLSGGFGTVHTEDCQLPEQDCEGCFEVLILDVQRKEEALGLIRASGFEVVSAEEKTGQWPCPQLELG